MSTIQDELIADLLGDVGKLHDSIKNLPVELSLTIGKVIETTNQLTESSLANIKNQETKSINEMEKRQKNFHIELKEAIKEEAGRTLKGCADQIQFLLKMEKKKTFLNYILFLTTGLFLGASAIFIMGITP